MDFEEILKEIKRALQAIFKDSFEDYAGESKKDIEAFLKESKEKLERWTKLLAARDITLDDFEWLVKSQKDLLIMKALYAAGISKIKLGHFKNRVIRTIVDVVKTVVL